MAGPSGARLIIGIGLNVATRLDVAPAEVRDMAATLAAAESGHDARQGVLTAILARLDSMLRCLAIGDPALVADWNRLDTLLGATITVHAGDDQFTAVAEGIDASGGLLIRRDGRVSVLHAGRILRD